MANRKELREARRKADQAMESLFRIVALPRRVGQTVTWTNGIVWTRLGDDRWLPSDPKTDWVGGEGDIAPSSHVASGHIV